MWKKKSSEACQVMKFSVLKNVQESVTVRSCLQKFQLVLKWVCSHEHCTVTYPLHFSSRLCSFLASNSFNIPILIFQILLKDQKAHFGRKELKTEHLCLLKWRQRTKSASKKQEFVFIADGATLVLIKIKKTVFAFFKQLNRKWLLLLGLEISCQYTKWKLLSG